MSKSICCECAWYRPGSPSWRVGFCTRDKHEVSGWSNRICFEPRQADHQESSNGATSTAIEGDLPTTRPTRESCLSAARDAVAGGREVAYGSPEDNFARIARLWAAFLHNKTGQEIAVNETDVALMLDLVKTARLQHNPGHVDSWVDKAGYSACGCEIGGQA